MSDLRNIALTLEATAAAEQVEAKFRLGHRVDAVRLGIAYALRHRLDLERKDWGRSGGTNYNVATVDTEDRRFASLVGIFYESPEATRNPYQCLETLMNKGLLLLKAHLDDGTVGRLADLGSDTPGDNGVPSAP
jgi:hypothetical protein